MYPISQAFTDLSKKSYQNALSYNDDHSGFIYTSTAEKQDWVFFPKLDSHETIENVAQKMINSIWIMNLPFNILPFVMAGGCSLFFLFIIPPISPLLHILCLLIIFVALLYPAKISFTIIGGILSQNLFLNKKFTVLAVDEGLGKYSIKDDKERAREQHTYLMGTVSDKSIVLANSYFIESRVYKEKNIQLAK